MVCSSYSRAGDILWRSLTGVTFVFCCLLVYHFLILHNDPCIAESGCLKSSKYTTDKLRSEKCSSVCNTKECIDISNYIMDNLDPTVDPCNDFYNFACGKFNDKYASNENISLFHRLATDFYTNLKGIIETSNEPHGTGMHKVKVVYDSCMDTGSSELKVMQSLLSFLRQIGLQNWPYLSSNFSFVSPQLPELLGKLISYKEDIFFKFDASTFEDDPSENLEDLSKLAVTFSGPVYTAEWELKELERVLTRILRSSGVDFKTIKKIWKDFITVEGRVGNLVKDIPDTDDIDANSAFETIKCQDEKNENRIMVCKILESVVRNGRLTPAFKNDQVNLDHLVAHYMDNAYNMIKNFSDREVANYIAVRVITHNLKYMNFAIRKSLNVFTPLPEEQASLFNVYPEKWKYCITWIAENMPWPLGAIYVDKMWPKEAADEINDLVHDILNTTADFVHRQDWIGELTKEEAIRDVMEQENLIHTVIEAMRNKTKINLMYRKFIPTRSNFMRNVLLHNKNLFYLSLLFSEEIKEFSALHPFGVNAYGGAYIYLTLGILTSPFFQHGYPKIFNIAKIGHISGHEIGHTIFYFLETSSNVDNVTQESFKEKIDCLIDQYFNFEQKRIKQHVLGNLTITENFPDNLGLKVIEKVSKKYLRSMTKNGFTLPGLSYSPEELLYITYAQTWCEVRSIEMEKYHHERDHHSPPEFRIKGAVQNSIRFSEVFNCSKTSYMNLPKKCVLFD